MPGRPILITACALTLACRGQGAEAVSSGRLVLDGDGRVHIDARAISTRCPRDSTLAVVATSEEWAVAFSARTTWPTDSTLDIPVGQILGAGTAVVAARPLTDSVGAALVSARGSLTIEPGPTLTGRIDVLVPTVPGAPDSVRLTGRFVGIPVTDDLCPDLGVP